MGIKPGNYSTTQCVDGVTVEAKYEFAGHIGSEGYDEQPMYDLVLTTRDLRTVALRWCSLPKFLEESIPMDTVCRLAKAQKAFES